MQVLLHLLSDSERRLNKDYPFSFTVDDYTWPPCRTMAQNVIKLFGHFQKWIKENLTLGVPLNILLTKWIITNLFPWEGTTFWVDFSDYWGENSVLVSALLLPVQTKPNCCHKYSHVNSPQSSKLSWYEPVQIRSGFRFLEPFQILIAETNTATLTSFWRLSICDRLRYN